MSVRASAARRALSSWPTKSHVLRFEHPGTKAAFDLVVGQLHERVAQERRQAGPLPIEVAQGLCPERFLGSTSPRRRSSQARSSSTRGALSRSRRSKRCSRLSPRRLDSASTWKILRVELEALDGARVADAEEPRPGRAGRARCIRRGGRRRPSRRSCWWASRRTSRCRACGPRRTSSGARRARSAHTGSTRSGGRPR